MDRTYERLPIELVNIILEYDGRIKYKKELIVLMQKKEDTKTKLLPMKAVNNK